MPLSATAPEQEKADAINSLAFRVAELERHTSGAVDEAQSVDEVERMVAELEALVAEEESASTDFDQVIETLLYHVESDDPEISLAAANSYIGFQFGLYDRNLTGEDETR